MIDKDGVYEGLSALDYHAAPRLNFSTLKLMSDCPEQCFLKEKGLLPEKDSDEMAFGRAYHSFVLTPKLFPLHYHVTEKIKRTGDAWDEILLSTGLSKDCIFWKEDEAKMKAMRQKLADHPAFPGLIKDSKRELTIYFTLQGLPCKARIDIYNPKLRMMGDLKTARSVTPTAFVSDAFRRNYHGQMAWYKLALESVGMPVDDVILVAQRKDPGFGVIQYLVTEKSLELGARGNTEMFFNYRVCVSTGIWPSYPEILYPLDPPDWFNKNKETEDGTESNEPD